MNEKSKIKDQRSKNKKFFPTIIFFVTISLVAQLILISSKTNSTTKNTTVTKAQEIQCPKILPVGSNIAANNSPENYQQIRALYNQQNAKVPCVSKSFIPTTVVYDLFFLKGGSDGIAQNLKEMSKNGLFPIIRVASYTSGNTWIKLYPPTDASIMGENLGKALDAVKGNFPATPIVVYLNEVNLHAEWQGQSNPEEFAESFDAFYKGLSKGSNFALFFPALSYGATDGNGITPQEFITRFFATKKFTGKLGGVALNIYGADYNDISNQYKTQVSAFGSGNSQIPTVIIELGPVRSGAAVKNCESDTAGWQTVSGPIATGVIQNNLSLATMACFGSVTYPAIVHYDGTTPQLVKLGNTGQIQNNTQNTTNTNNNTTNNQQQNQTTTGASGLTFNPQNPKPGDQLRVTASSKTGLVWVNLAGDGPDGEKINMAGKTPGITRDSQGYHWTYTVENVKKGTYAFVFSDHCDKYNKQGQPLAAVCDNPVAGNITVGENNSQQSTNTTNTNASNQKQQINTTNSQSQKTNTNSQTRPKQLSLNSQTSTPGQITFLKDDLNKIGNGSNVNFATAKNCYNITANNRNCQNAKINSTSNTITIEYLKDNPPQGFCFDLINNPNAQSVCIYKPET